MGPSKRYNHSFGLKRECKSRKSFFICKTFFKYFLFATLFFLCQLLFFYF